MNKLRRVDPDFYYEHIYENPDENHDMAKNRSKFKPEEVAKLKKSHDYWENARLKAWSERFKAAKSKRSGESFEYLL
jgi:DNA/RNA-binding domain of Phe-tRNA-synthetase-like protein